MIGRGTPPRPAVSGRPELSPAQRLDWLRLIRSEGVGPRTFFGLINRFGGAGAALEALPALARAKAGRDIRVATRAEVERELETAGRFGVSFVARGESAYPQALAVIADPPPLIAVRGRTEVLSRPMVAIVGSRNASAAGLRMTERLAAGLGRHGLVIASGLARGIDTRAHQAALPTGTVAVLAGGHDRIYPPENAALLEEILDGGVVVSEMPLGWEPRGRDFPRRNRIVSGLGFGTIVVEAAIRSGSLITARFALEQGREVFAVPGSPLDPRAEGTNDLIRQRATLVRSVEDVMEVLAPMLSEPAPPSSHMADGAPPDDDREPLWDELDLLGTGGAPMAPLTLPSETPAGLDVGSRLLGLLGTTGVDLDEIARAAGLPVRETQLALFELELAGHVERQDGGRFTLSGA